MSAPPWSTQTLIAGHAARSAEYQDLVLWGTRTQMAEAAQVARAAATALATRETEQGQAYWRDAVAHWQGILDALAADGWEQG